MRQMSSRENTAALYEIPMRAIRSASPPVAGANRSPSPDKIATWIESTLKKTADWREAVRRDAKKSVADGSTYFQITNHTSMKLTGGMQQRKEVGSLAEVSSMTRAARLELKAFAKTKLPPDEISYAEKLMFGFLLFNFRQPTNFLVKIFPSIRLRPFTRSIITIGGLERVQLLISIAQFDMDGDNNVSIAEFQRSASAAGVIIMNAIACMQNYSLVAALMFVATHLASIHRPKTFVTLQATIDLIGEDRATIIMSARELNVLSISLGGATAHQPGLLGRTT